MSDFQFCLISSISFTNFEFWSIKLFSSFGISVFFIWDSCIWGYNYFSNFSYLNSNIWNSILLFSAFKSLIYFSWAYISFDICSMLFSWSLPLSSILPRMSWTDWCSFLFHSNSFLLILHHCSLFIGWVGLLAFSYF